MKKKVINILFESFYNNKSINFIVKQDKKKDKRLKILLEYSYFLGENFGKIYLNEKKSACAILIDSNKRKITFRSIVWDLKLLFQCIGLFNIKKAIKRERLIKKYHPKVDFIHLWYIGVLKDQQGKGIGSELMNQIIQDYESKDRPIYLETSTERNFMFYEKLGFKRISQIEDLGYLLNIYLK